MSAEHRKPVMAFVVLALVAAGVVGIQRADAQGGRLLAAVVGVSAQVHGTLPLAGHDAARAAREQAAAMGPMFAAVLASEKSAVTEQATTGHARPARSPAGPVAALPLVVTAEQTPARPRAQVASTDARSAGRSSGDATKRTAARRGGAADAARDERRVERRRHAEDPASGRAAERAQRRAEKRAKHLSRAQHQAEKRAAAHSAGHARQLQRRLEKAAQRAGHPSERAGHGSRGRGRGHSRGAGGGRWSW